MRIFTTLLSVFLTASSVLAQKAPSADELAHRTINAMGGMTALERARYVSFTFKVEKDKKEVASFPQRWDRLTGDYHVSGRRPDGLPFEATINVNTGAVKGTIQGRTVTTPEEQKKLFQFAYERYVSDTFFLMMPLMMLDPPFAGLTNDGYEIVASIGAGGMGEVYRARDTRLDRGRDQNPPGGICR